MAAYPATPELDKRSGIINSRVSPTQTLGEFYDWLQAQGLVLARWDKETQEYLPDFINPEQLFANFFGLDSDKMEQERRAILEALRQQ